MDKLEITLVIDTFKKVLNDYETAIKNNYVDDLSIYICTQSRIDHNVNINSLFNSSGYYKNYINTRNCLLIPNSTRSTCNIKDLILWKIDFLKKEIKELTILKEKGYTHI